LPPSDPSIPSIADFACHSSDEILAHSRFPAARAAFVDALLGLYEGDAFLNRLLLEAGRMVIFTNINCLHAGYDKADRATWPTMRLLQEVTTPFGVASPRRIEDLVARLIHCGLLESVVSQRDRRFRILTPTARMLSLDQDWLSAHYQPLRVMFPDPGYALPVRRDPGFQHAQRLVAIGFFTLAAQILTGNPAMMLFLSRDVGVMVLIKLIQMTSDRERSPERLSYTDLGARFGVSRTHVRTLLQDAEQAGLVSLPGRGGRLVELTPAMLQAFDRFVAESMSAHDLLFRLAIGRSAGTGRRPRSWDVERTPSGVTAL
jgi:hypothetical protein